jgi:hypothetical protein
MVSIAISATARHVMRASNRKQWILLSSVASLLPAIIHDDDDLASHACSSLISLALLCFACELSSLADRFGPNTHLFRMHA